MPRANALGLAYVPADRKREGLHLIHRIGFNLMLPAFAPAAGAGLREPLGRSARPPAPSPPASPSAATSTRPVQALSGGNQQKVALAKWMPRDPPIFLLNDPTRGVDVETKREIYVMLAQLRRGRARPSCCSAPTRRSWCISATASP